MDKMISKLMEESEREFHIREMAKILNMSPTTISKKISFLTKENLIISKRMSNHLLFKANTENIKFKQLKKEYNFQKLITSGLIEHLENELNHPEAIILFGSFAKGEDIPRSDIDIFIVSPNKKEINLEKFEKNLRHNIQIFTHSKKEIETMKKTNKELLNNIINGTVILGYLEVFS
jgi:predicted nucleotidyltransferase